MKFFTPAWVQGKLTEAETEQVVPAYWKHVDTQRFPPAVLELARINPHDGRILDVAYDPRAATLRLRLRCGDLQSGYRDTVMLFSGLHIEESSLTALMQSRRPATVEILYDEVDRCGTDAFAYRILLDSGIEAGFNFTDVKVEERPVGDRELK